MAYHSPYDGLRANTELPRYCVDISHLGEQRRSLVCQLCRRKGGVVPCCCSGCGRGVHASCALKYELEMFWNNKIGHSGVPVEEVLVEKDFFIHCFNHSGGFQGRGVPHKRCDDYRSPLSEKETRRKRQNDEFVLTDAEQLELERQEQEAILNTIVYAYNGSGARYYHAAPVCGNQSNGRKLTVGEAMQEHLGACDVCNPPVYGLGSSTFVSGDAKDDNS